MNRFRTHLLNTFKEENRPTPYNKTLYNNIDIRFISTFIFAGFVSGINWFYQSKWA